MKRIPYFFLMGSLLTTGAWFWRNQQRELHGARSAVPSASATAAQEPEPASPFAPARKGPSVELLRLRGEVTQLRAELDRDPVRAQADAKAATEWAQVFEEARPSRMPDFVAFADLAPRGTADPIAAFATFQYRMRHQLEEPMTPTRMKEVWSVPEDFDDPRARYSIHLGRGFGHEIGYRVVEQQVIQPGEVRLVIDLEDADGGNERIEQVLTENGGRWRVKPVSVTRIPDPADD